MSIWTISREQDGVHADAIIQDGRLVLHLIPGTQTNEANIERIVERLNTLEAIAFLKEQRNQELARQ